MTTIGKRTGLAMSMPGGLAVGGAWSIMITLALSVAAAKLVDMGILGEGSIGYAAMAILLVSSLTSGMIARNRIKRQKLLVCALSSGIYLAILLSITALFFGGQYEGIGVTALIVLCGGAMSALIGTRQGGGAHKGKGTKRRHR